MEIFFPSFSFTIIFSLILFIFMLLKVGRKSTSKTPPGPWKLPIIGNIHQLVGSSQPHHALRDLANKYGPLMHLQLGEVCAIVISSADMAKEVMKTHDIKFATRPHIPVASVIFYGATDILFAPYGGYWRQVRKICTLELLSAKRVQSFKYIRDEEMFDLVKSINLSVGTPINLSEKVMNLAYGNIARAAFGVKCKDQELFISIVKQLSNVAAGFDVSNYFPSIKLFGVVNGMIPKLKKLHKLTDEILENIIEEHKTRVKPVRNSKGEVEAEDLVDVLIKCQNDGDLEFPLTTNNIKSVILDMFIAGSETSATTVDWAMVEMMRHPKVMEKAQAEVRLVFDIKGGKVDETHFHELEYLKLVIKETLRLHPVVPLLPRECSEICEINGYKIPIKSRPIINAWAIGRDPNYWTEPENFIPERFLDSPVDFKGTYHDYLPFGAGRRMCPGIVYGTTSVEVQLVHLLYHFDWKIPNGIKKEDLDLTENFGATVRRKDDLYLVPISYNHESSIASGMS